VQLREELLEKNALVDRFDYYLKKLFSICRSITGEGSRSTLRILQEIIPLSINEVPSGLEVYDWVVPNEWNIKDAYIEDNFGERLIDFNNSNLHVVSYSEPVDAVFTWDQIKSHLHLHPTLPEAIPYLTSYYERNWGFCVTLEQYERLKKSAGPFKVKIDSSLKPGSLTYGEYLLAGSSKQEILISCYICHPSMANDSLSGVILTAILAEYLTNIHDRHWSYRFVFVPETIGAISYCALNEDTIKQIDFGLVITTVGGPGAFGYKQSWNENHNINVLIERSFEELGKNYLTYPFDIHGSDERQYSSQGFRVNMATISKDRYYEYAQYHTSLDDLNFVNGEQIYETYEVYKHLLQKIENRKVYRNLYPHCEVMLSKHDLYPKLGGTLIPGVENSSVLDLILWILFLCDGCKTLEEIALKLSVDIASLELICEDLVTKGIIEVV
jgi:aminopeptidase-like protein